MTSLKLTASRTIAGFIEEATVTGKHPEYATPDAFLEALNAYAAGLESIGADVAYPAGRTARRAFNKYLKTLEGMRTGDDKHRYQLWWSSGDGGELPGGEYATRAAAAAFIPRWRAELKRVGIKGGSFHVIDVETRECHECGC